MIQIRHHSNGVTTFKLKTTKEAERFLKMAIDLKCAAIRKGVYVHVL